MNDELRRKVEDAQVEGWKVLEEHGEHKAVMVKRSYGSLGAHVLIALLTVWWTLGLGNILYAAYVYFGKADKKVLRAEEDDQQSAVGQSFQSGPAAERDALNEGRTDRPRANDTGGVSGAEAETDGGEGEFRGR